MRRMMGFGGFDTTKVGNIWETVVVSCGSVSHFHSSVLRARKWREIMMGLPRVLSGNRVLDNIVSI